MIPDIGFGQGERSRQNPGWFAASATFAIVRPPGTSSTGVA
jgi:hypothetical protein